MERTTCPSIKEMLFNHLPMHISPFFRPCTLFDIFYFLGFSSANDACGPEPKVQHVCLVVDKEYGHGECDVYAQSTTTKSFFLFNSDPVSHWVIVAVFILSFIFPLRLYTRQRINVPFEPIRPEAQLRLMKRVNMCSILGPILMVL